MDDLFDIVEDETLSFDDDKIYFKEKEKSKEKNNKKGIKF